jgi:hypothetical protein
MGVVNPAEKVMKSTPRGDVTGPVNAAYGGTERVPIVPPVRPTNAPVSDAIGGTPKVGAKLIAFEVTVTLPVILATPAMIDVAEAEPAKARHTTALAPSTWNIDLTLNLLIDKTKAILFFPETLN